MSTNKAVTGEGNAPRKTNSTRPRCPRCGLPLRYSLRELRRMPTLSTGQFSNLKIDDGKTRVWLSRMTVEDGMPYNNAIEVERLIEGVWVSVDQYPGDQP